MKECYDKKCRMIRFLSLSSGSNGNCYYIGNEMVALLIDAGIGGRTIKKRLLQNNISPESIKFILVTHDHIDHIRHLGSIAKNYHLPVFAPEKLHAALADNFCTREHISPYRRVIDLDEESEHFGIRFKPFEVPHDATQTLGYYIDFYGTKIVVMTDLGDVTEEAVEYCRKANYVVLESNYDLDMLLTGSYHPLLKNRIIEGHGHLSNEKCADIIKKIYHKDLRHIFLCHLSENNNTPEKAYRSAYEALTELCPSLPSTIELTCLPRRSASDLYTWTTDKIAEIYETD